MELNLVRLPENGYIAVQTFNASRHPTESCGSNGLPLTPNSISILGQAERLKTLSLTHPNLCVFLDCLRGKHERIAMVSEFYKDNVKTRYLESDKVDRENLEQNLIKIAREVLFTLEFLNKENIVHGSLDPSNILLLDNHKVKLYNFGMGHTTSYGRYVSFPIFSERYVAPEVITFGCPESVSQSPVEVGDVETMIFRMLLLVSTIRILMSGPWE